MKFFYYIHKARKLPFQIVLLKAIKLFWRNIKEKKLFFRDQLLSTYMKKDNNINAIKFNFSLMQFNELKTHKELILGYTYYYNKHHFDLLGSGWSSIYYGVKARGLEGYCYTDSELGYKENLRSRINRANLKQSQKIASLIDVNYKPIDWQLDFKSGYRWSEKSWYVNINYGHKPGIDIKVPWELSRMQHLVVLAYAYMVADTGERKKYFSQYRNQILDFIANNPPRFGVNWRCTMDVGIRVANWLMAYDLFKAAGAKFDSEFQQIFACAVYDHGNHIINNLEYTPHLRSNHYLSDIAGLLYVAVHLESDKEIDCWLAFAIQELISEVEHEFHPDGSNFEASTSYHRLSTEIILYCAILCLNLPKEKKMALISYNVTEHHVKPKLKEVSEQLYNINQEKLFPDWFWERLERACEFTLHITKPNGEIPQIGDNDSGRFFKLWPSYNEMTVKEAVLKYSNLDGYEDLPENALYYDENILDHQHILAVGGVLFKREDFIQKVRRDNLEKALVESLLVGKVIRSYHLKKNLTHAVAYNRYIVSERDLNQWKCHLQSVYGQPKVSIFADQQDRNIVDHLQVFSYPNFGLYIYKSQHLYLAIRCGSVGQCRNGGHAHNDQLSIELYMNGKDVIRDPGTYVYTPLLEKRNVFRSTNSHFTPQIPGMEQNGWRPGIWGLFQLDRIADYEVLLFDRSGFVGTHSGFGDKVYRIVEISTRFITVFDYGVGISSIKHTNLYSNGYGKLYRECNNLTEKLS
ncbi:alginate lyase family protein [Propionispora hippei]|uniref:Heparinase II/III-like protein n=1 Tax=Propionispora hippei DSM 15287 TaxID=1123003 RepID=A0A1M6K271_9FIRM|nr:alginate lyase family protein [Propionispora hippei]SHJ53053.1 Heparinase II/III-like protein [Propionispora hippei DSM 15287]